MSPKDHIQALKQLMQQSADQEIEIEFGLDDVQKENVHLALDAAKKKYFVTDDTDALMKIIRWALNFTESVGSQQSLLARLTQDGLIDADEVPDELEGWDESFTLTIICDAFRFYECRS